MYLEDLKKSISKMSREEIITTLTEIRNNRLRANKGLSPKPISENISLADLEKMIGT